jgi:hypothetical protein
MKRKRTITLEIQVTAPAATGEWEIERAINAALDEPPCEWGEWKVGAAVVTTAHNVLEEDEPDVEQIT